ncbi:MAG TPA: hypothetical protein VI461_16230 [Chitinophagaceae bacterium]|nr:hypothetical protein [Chitinophagaceae bacterium]
MNKSLAVLFLFFAVQSQAQTQDKWANNVKWDGVTAWHRYMIYSPAYMGPNAIPVPSMANGGIDSINYFGVSGAFFFAKGDNTQSFKLSGNYCLVKDLVSFDASWIPVEYFQMNTEVKDKRHVYWNNYYEKKAGGDLLLNMNVRLLKKWDKNVQLAFRVGYRFPASNTTGVAAARFTDAPGYFFNLSAGKFLSSDNKWKLSGMAGFYVWQLNDFGQNDAFLFGAGLEYNAKGWHWHIDGRSFTGWLGNGDFPIVTSSSLEKRFKKAAFFLTLQQGLQDFDYTSFETGIKYLFAQK